MVISNILLTVTYMCNCKITMKTLKQVKKLKVKIKNRGKLIKEIKKKSYEPGCQDIQSCGNSRLPYIDWRKTARPRNHRNNHKSNQLEVLAAFLGTPLVSSHSLLAHFIFMFYSLVHHNSSVILKCKLDSRNRKWNKHELKKLALKRFSLKVKNKKICPLWNGFFKIKIKCN